MKRNRYWEFDNEAGVELEINQYELGPKRIYLRMEQGNVNMDFKLDTKQKILGLISSLQEIVDNEYVGEHKD